MSSVQPAGLRESLEVEELPNTSSRSERPRRSGESRHLRSTLKRSLKQLFWMARKLLQPAQRDLLRRFGKGTTSEVGLEKKVEDGFALLERKVGDLATLLEGRSPQAFNTLAQGKGRRDAVKVREACL